MSRRLRRSIGAAAILAAVALLFWVTAVVTSELPQTFVVAVNVHGLDLNPGVSTGRPAPMSLSVLADAQQDSTTTSPTATSSTSNPPNPSTSGSPATRPTPTPSPSPTSPVILPSPSLPTPTPRPSPTAMPAATIAGQVLDAQTRNPIAGATVSASPGGYLTVSDTSGNFSLSVAPATYTLTASAALYNSASTTVTLKAGQKISVAFKLTSSTTYGSIAGSVTDSNTGAPVVGATVRLSNGLIRVTDTNGNFSYSLVLSGSYTLTVSAVGYVTQSVPVSVRAGKTSNVQISLVP